MTSWEGERLGKGSRVVMCSGREERDAVCGSERFRDVFSGAMGVRMILTRLSIVVSLMSKIWRSCTLLETVVTTTRCGRKTGLGLKSPTPIGFLAFLRNGLGGRTELISVAPVNLLRPGRRLFSDGLVKFLN